MATRRTGGGQGTKRAKKAEGEEGKRKGKPGIDPARPNVLETGTDAQEDLLQGAAQSGIPVDPLAGEASGWGSLLEELPDEEDLTPEMGGHDDDQGYWGDPDGDFAECAVDFNPIEACIGGKEDSRVEFTPRPDVLIEEEHAGDRRTFRPYPVSQVAWHRWGLNERARGSKAYPQARRLMQSLRERQKRLVQIAEVIVEHQRDYFEHLFDGADPEEAFLALKPLTHVEVQKRIGDLDHELVGALARSSFLQPDIPGAVPLPMSLFFGDAGSLGVRTDVLAVNIRRLINQQPGLTVKDLQKILEQRTLIPHSRDESQRRSTYERLRQIAQGMRMDAQTANIRRLIGR